MEYCRANMEEGRSDNRGKLEPVDQQPPPPRRGEAAGNGRHQPPPPPPRNCPRCDSANTKFCYYNNYSLSQPRYFCKACRRYWTHGGTLRNVPVGGGCRRAKRQRLSASAASSSRPPANSSPANRSTNSTGMSAVESSIRDFPPSIGNSFYSGGGFLSSLAAATEQSAPGAANHAAAMVLGHGITHYGANMALLQGINLSSTAAPLPAAAADQFQSQNEFNTPPRIFTNYLTQNFLHRDDTAAATSSTPGQGFWGGGGAASDGNNQAGSSFNPAQWPDHSKYHGLPPPQ